MREVIFAGVLVAIALMTTEAPLVTSSNGAQADELNPDTSETSGNLVGRFYVPTTPDEPLATETTDHVIAVAIPKGHIYRICNRDASCSVFIAPRDGANRKSSPNTPEYNVDHGQCLDITIGDEQVWLHLLGRKTNKDETLCDHPILVEYDLVH